MTPRMRFKKADRKRRRRLHYSIPLEDMTPDQLTNHVQWLEHDLRGVETALTAIDTFLDSGELERLRPLGLRLNQATDDMNAAIRQCERALATKYRGRCAAVEINERYALLFWHVEGVWGLYAVNSRGELKRLTSTPRAVRTVACAVLEDLWSQLQYEDEAA